MKKLAVLLSIVAPGYLMSCAESHSEVKADHRFHGVKINHWYETFNFIPGDAKNFADYYKNRADTMLGNQDAYIPESLKGLWYMDGNPIGDQTFSMSHTEQVRTNTGDIRWTVATPMVFSWLDTAQNHFTIAALMATHLEYELKWYDCPLDVKHEREERYGMKDGSCLASDHEFAIITAFVKVGLLRTKLPSSLAYFDMYLRPKTSDHLVWERRSKVFESLTSIGNIFKKATESEGFHRYQFTQILDKEGNTLSSFAKFQTDVTRLAAKHGRPIDGFLLLTCNEGEDGCDMHQNKESLEALETEGELFEVAKIPAL